MARSKKGVYNRWLKRPLDCLLALFGLIIMSPVFLIIAILIRVKLGRPILFKQQRPGRHEQVFTLYKFKTMTDEVDANGELLPNQDRLTPFGQKLRSTSLDELPELINILKGDMSLVGPRPLLVQYLPLYDQHQRRRHEARPGLTGLAQVNGRNAISWEDKFDYDIQYVDHISFIGDSKILFSTLKKVLSQEGINSDSSTTMEPFKGRKEDTE